jgi:4-amino-4-deoxy-L-arabinose transferase-like glycosyltransferase
MRGAVLVVALAVPTFFLWLGRPAITDSDEAYYAEAAREMVESGNWVTPYFNYEPRFEKPILYYWLVAATYAAIGVGEAAARAWSAMSAIGLSLVAYGCGKRWFGRTPGLLAGVMTATSLGIFMIAREALPDLPLAFFVTAGIWALMESVSAADPEDRRRQWLLAGSASLAFGFLTKGPIAIALPTAAIAAWLVWCWWAPVRGRLRVPPVRDLAMAAGLFLLLAAPWYVMVTRQNGLDYLQRFFVGENLERFATTKFNEPRPFLYYVPMLIAGLLPWSTFMLLWIKPAVDVIRRVRPLNEIERRLICWAGGPFLVLTMSIGKQPRYILPCLPPLAVLLAQTIVARLAERSRRRDTPVAAAGTLAGVVMIALAWLIGRAAPLLSAVNPAFDFTGAIVIGVIGAATIAIALANRRLLPVTLAVGGAVTLLAAHRSVMMIGRPEPVETIAKAAAAGGVPKNVCTCGAFGRNLSFYSRRQTVMEDYDEGVRDVLTRPEWTVAAIDVDVLARAEAAIGRRFVRSADVRYLNTALLRIDMFLHPDPATQLQRVLFVSNR